MSVGFAQLIEVTRGCTFDATECFFDERGDVEEADSAVRKREEKVRFDHLETFVRERRRIDCDLRAHRPCRMRKRLLRRDVGQLIARAATERSTTRREDKALRLAELRALKERGVLAV